MVRSSSNRRRWVIGTILCLGLGAGGPGVGNLAAEPMLRYRFEIGDRYRIIGTNRQTVLLNGAVIGTAETLTKIQTEVVNNEAGVGVLAANYQVSEESTGGTVPFQLAREYAVEFRQAPDGTMQVARNSFVPQVRNVPTFPLERPDVGTRWHAAALDVYDFREGFGVTEPVEVPFNAFYRYLGPREVGGIPTDHIEINYNLHHRPPVGSDAARLIRLITGQFALNLDWDSARGRAHAYTEQYSLVIQLTDGRRFEFRGTADAAVIGVEPLDRRTLREELQEAIDAAGDSDTQLTEDDRGVTIVMENIQFAPDSAVLLPSERAKIERFGDILRRYPDRDLLISGHTALAGTVEGRTRLSEARAAAVGTYLMELGVRNRDRMLYQGLGATQPIAENVTEEGRRRNRRVEITILEN